MSEQLQRTIKKVKSEIENNRDAFKREPPTKQSLILPVLNALGWDVFDHTRVHPEFPTGSGEVDWALKIQGKPAVLVEAKSLSTQLDAKELNQLSRYCFDLGVPTALLTNGAEWRVYRPLLALGKLAFEHRLLFHLRLDKDNEAESVKQLSRLHYDNLDQLEKEDLNILLDAYWNEHAREELLKPFSDTLRESLINWSGEKPSEIPSRAVSAWLRKRLFSGRRASATMPRPRPAQSSTQGTGRAVVLAGERISVRTAKDVLVQTAEWLVQQGRLQSDDCPIVIGTGKLYLIHTSPSHSDGNVFTGPKKLSNGLYVHTNFGTNPIIRKSQDLLQHFGYSSDTLQIIGFDN